MIVSVHIVDAGVTSMPTALRHKPRPEAVPGLLYAETTVTAPQGGGGRLPLYPGRFGLIAAWEDDAPTTPWRASSSPAGTPGSSRCASPAPGRRFPAFPSANSRSMTTSQSRC